MKICSMFIRLLFVAFYGGLCFSIGETHAKHRLSSRIIHETRYDTNYIVTLKLDLTNSGVIVTNLQVDVPASYLKIEREK